MAGKEYIERDALLSAAKGYDWIAGLKTLMKRIPAADVRPVTRGEWIDHQEGRWIYAKCSECETVHDVRSNFCPNCGADMRPEPPKEE
jgi:hypothetical protein